MTFKGRDRDEMIHCDQLWSRCSASAYSVAVVIKYMNETSLKCQFHAITRLPRVILRWRQQPSLWCAQAGDYEVSF